MKLTSKSRYAIRALMFLADQPEASPQPLSRIKQCGLPGDYLEHLLRRLKQQGLVQSVRGNQGGYLLARPASEISLHDVISAVEGPGMLSMCAKTAPDCGDADHCGLNLTWARVSRGIEALMSSYSLEDLMNNEGRPGTEHEPNLS